MSRESQLNWALAEWTIGDYVIRTSGGLRVRLPRRPGLAFRPKPPDFEEFQRLPRDFTRNCGSWEYVSKAELRNVLAEFFAIPFDEYEGLCVRGHIETLAGVDVFTGQFELRKTTGKIEKEQAEDAQHEWTGPHRILITDSDPQYLCVSFGISFQD